MFRYKYKGKYTLHSGDQSAVKISLDEFTGEDWAAAAFWGSKLVGPFNRVYDCGGASLAFADALRRVQGFTVPAPSLVVDDVLTTGKTMETVHQIALKESPEGVKGLVVFARGPLPVWVRAIFELNERLRGE